MKYILIVSLVLINTYAAKYNLNDLVFLHDERNYQEFFKRMYDIRPSERGAQWQTLVTTMGRGFIDEKLKLNHLQRSTLKIIEKLSNEPILREDPKFSTDRLKYAKRYIYQCNDKNCDADLISFWTAQPKTIEQTTELIKSLSEKQKLTDASIWAISFEHIIKSSDSDICKNNNIQKQILRKITVENDPTASEISEGCLKASKDYIRNSYFKLSSLEREKVIQLFESKGIDNTLEKDLHYTLFFLQNSQTGDNLNWAWSTLDFLGKSYERRNKVLSSLKKLDPYPDKLFSKLKTKSGKVLLRHFARNFPEYLDFYLRECANFLSGYKVFINGNPTVYCKQLVNNHETSKLLNTSLVNTVQNKFL